MPGTSGTPLMRSDLLPQFLHRHRLSLKPGLPSLIRGSAKGGMRGCVGINRRTVVVGSGLLSRMFAMEYGGQLRSC